MNKSVKKTLLLISVLLALVLVFASCSPPSLNAYQNAVKNGFSGTYDDWLIALETSDYFYVAGQLETQYKKAVEEGYQGTIEEWLAMTYVSPSKNSEQGAAAKALKSVVCIQSGFDNWEYGSSGSGVIFHEDDAYAYIVTNFHVVYENESQSKISDEIEVFLYGMYYTGFEIRAEYIGGSVSNDIAVIRIPKNERYLSSAAAPAAIADSLQIKTGQTAIAIGNADGEGFGVTSGIISVESEYIDVVASDESAMLELRVMRIDTPVNPGNSGGGLFNADGELIGIVSAKHLGSKIDDIGYAIPTNIALSVARRLLSGGTLTKVVFGIEMQITDVATVFDEAAQTLTVNRTITVMNIVSGSAAEGYLRAGDVLQAFTYGGVTVPIKELHTMGDYIFEFRQNDEITFTVLRDGVVQQVTMPMTNVVEAG